MKKISDEFVISVGLLLISFFIFQAAILPGMNSAGGEYQTARVTSTAFTREYNIEPSSSIPGTYSFEYKQDKLPELKREKYFDAPIIPFDEAVARKEIGKNKIFTGFGPFKDRFGYPLPAAVYESSMGIAKSDPGQIPGTTNCRANTNVTGYFIAIFQDIQQNTGAGYADPVFGQGRQDEVCNVLQDIATLIKLDQTDVTPSIFFSEDTGMMPPNALASASPLYDANDLIDANNGALFDLIVKRDSSWMFQAIVHTNFGPGVSWDVDSTLNPNTYDFYTVMSHEMLHALGFTDLTGGYVAQLNEPKLFGTWNQGLYRDDTLADKLLAPVTNLSQMPVGAPSPWLTTDEVVYKGVKNTPGATPDGTRPVYSPGLWEWGSSLSHFDMNRSNGAVYTMNPSIGPNTVRPIHNDEKEVLCHMGYAVLRVPGCGGFTPVSRNDSLLLDGTPSCIEPLLNDESLSGGILTMNSVRELQLENGDTLTYRAGLGCTGAVLAGPNGAKSFEFIPSASMDNRVLTYDNKDSVSNRISNESHISFVPCDNALGEHICNGDFEDEVLTQHVPFGGEWNVEMVCGGLSYDGGYKIPWWCNHSGSPDMPATDAPTNQDAFNLPFDCSSWFTGCFVESPDGSDRILRTVTDLEATKTKLETTLVPGQAYVFSADVLTINYAMPVSYNMKVGLEHNDTLSATFGYGLGPVVDQIIVDEPIPSNDPDNDWTHIEEVFIPDDAYDFLVMYSPDFSVLYADNVSVKPYTGNPGGEITNVDLKVTKELNDATLSLFDRHITWRVRVANLSGNNATNIVVSDLIPPGLIYVSHTTQNPQESYDPVSGAYYIPSIAGNGQTSINIVMKVPTVACGIKTNTASLTSLDQTDTNPSNNQSSVGIKLKLCRAQTVK